MSSQAQKATNPDLVQNPKLSQWITIDQDGMILLRAGKVELGQGIGIVQMQIVAEELGIPVTQIRMIAGHTDISVDQGYTSGSNSVQVGAMALRQVCRQIRQLFTAAASTSFQTSIEQISLTQGMFSVPNSSQALSYLDLAPKVDLYIPASPDAVINYGSTYDLSGRNIQRPDLQKKLFSAGFIHDLEIEGMVHGRMIRPPSYRASLVSFSEDARAQIQAMPGVICLMITGRLIGVCAVREEQAIAAAKKVHSIAQWVENDCLPAEQSGQTWLRNMPTQDSTVDASQQSDKQVCTTIDVNYSKPFIAHASIGPSCALAQWNEKHLTVWTHGQGSFPMRRELSNLFEIPLDNITVIHADGAGCYGHNGADDAAFDAAMLAKAAGRPVRLQWSREDEFSWSPHGSAMSVNIEAGIDEHAKIVKWNYQIWSHTHVQRPGMAPGLRCLAGIHKDPAAPELPWTDFALSAGGGGQRNAVPLYDFPNRRIDYHLIAQSTLRSSALRALGAFANIFAIESCMDELAIVAAQDPIEFRLKHLTEPRAREVLERVANLSNWAIDRKSEPTPEVSHGYGVGFAQYKNNGAYCAVVVQIQVTDQIILNKIWVAVDAGEVIHPDGLKNQIEGGVLQAASWTLKEAIHWDEKRVTTQGWEDYPILRFDETPDLLLVDCIDRPELPPLGVGECAAGPTAAAIANALYNAIGIRMRDLPLTPERLAQAVMQA